MQNDQGRCDPLQEPLLPDKRDRETPPRPSPTTAKVALQPELPKVYKIVDGYTRAWELIGPVLCCGGHSTVLVPALLILGNKVFGVSSNLSHLLSGDLLRPHRVFSLRLETHRPLESSFCGRHSGWRFLRFALGWSAGRNLGTDQTGSIIMKLGVRDLSGPAPGRCSRGLHCPRLKDLSRSLWVVSRSGSAPHTPEVALPATRSQDLRSSSDRIDRGDRVLCRRSYRQYDPYKGSADGYSPGLETRTPGSLRSVRDKPDRPPLARVRVDRIDRSNSRRGEQMLKTFPRI
jgi:hypothetical protein